MMSDDEIAELGDDIKANGLQVAPRSWRDDDGKHWLVDGRNRLEAMERTGLELPLEYDLITGDPLAHIPDVPPRHAAEPSDGLGY